MLRMANPIYAEVVQRELTQVLGQRMPHRSPWYVDSLGGGHERSVGRAPGRVRLAQERSWADRAYREPRDWNGTPVIVWGA